MVAASSKKVDTVATKNAKTKNTSAINRHKKRLSKNDRIAVFKMCINFKLNLGMKKPMRTQGFPWGCFCK